MLAGSLSLEDEEAVQAELQQLQLQTVRHISITRGLVLMILQLEVSDERPIDLPSVPTAEPATPAKGKIFCETLPLLLTYDALAPEPESRSQETERVPVAA